VAHGAALSRLARAYEAEPEKRADLLQEIHVALWRSLGGFNGSCSLRTWVFRIAHNVAASHVLRERRRNRVRQVALKESRAPETESMHPRDALGGLAAASALRTWQ